MSSQDPCDKFFDSVRKGMLKKVEDDMTERMLGDFTTASAAVDAASNRNIAQDFDFSQMENWREQQTLIVRRNAFHNLCAKVRQDQRVTQEHLDDFLQLGGRITVRNDLGDVQRVQLELDGECVEIAASMGDAKFPSVEFNMSQLYGMQVMQPPDAIKYMYDANARIVEPPKPMTDDEKAEYFKRLRRKAGLKD